jgi:AcrR family transcriptional regulator
MPDSRSAASSPAKTEADERLSGLLAEERLPSGRADLVEPLVARSHRERILVAFAESCAQEGYGATTIGEIVKRAGISRATFYELFENKEECFCAAMELSMADAMGGIVSAYSPDKPWAAMVRDAAAALLDLFARRPAFARMALVEAPADDGRAGELYASGKRVLQALLEQGREDPVEEPGIPPSAGRAAIAAAESLIVGQILAENTERLPELLPDVVYITTVPYLGREGALRQFHAAERSLEEKTTG